MRFPAFAAGAARPCPRWHARFGPAQGLLLALLLPLQVFAADPGPPPPTPPPASDFPPPPPPPVDAPPPATTNDCVPACRSGYACQNGACVPAGTAPSDAPVADQDERPEPGENPLINSRGERAPRGQHWELKRKVGLLITGASLFVVGYGLAVFTGLVSYQRPGASIRLLHFIPLAGPALSEFALITNASGNPFGPNNTFFLDVLFMVADTALQVTGLILALVGIGRREVLVDDPPGYQRPAEPRQPADPNAPPARDSNLPPIQWSFAPVGPAGSLGLSFGGTF